MSSTLVSFIGAKGGTLKSASVAAVSHVMARGAMRVLMFDGDPQGDLTRRSGFHRVAAPLEADMVQVAYPGQPTMDLRLMCGGRSLEGESLPAIRRHIRRATESGAHVVVADTPPAIGVLTTSVIEASSMVIIPAMPGIESLERAGDVMATIERVNPTCTVRILITLAHLQSAIFARMVSEVDKLFPGMRLQPVIPFEMAAAESGFFRLPVTVTAQNSKAARAYAEVAIEIIKHVKDGMAKQHAAVAPAREVVA